MPPSTLTLMLHRLRRFRTLDCGWHVQTGCLQSRTATGPIQETMTESLGREVVS
jgi:hypothetical protein